MMKFTLLALVLLAAGTVHSKGLGCGGLYSGGSCGGAVVGTTRVAAAAPVAVAAAPVVAAKRVVLAESPAVVTRRKPLILPERVPGIAPPPVIVTQRVPGAPLGVAAGCVKRVPSLWGNYGPWSKCSKTCGVGVQIRSRECHRGGACTLPCVGKATVTRACGEPARAAYWTGGSKWNKCSTSCGIGKQIRTRDCVRNACDTRLCSGPSRQVRTCGTKVLIAACRQPVAVAAAPVAVAAAPVGVVRSYEGRVAYGVDYGYGYGGGCRDFRNNCGALAYGGYCGRASVYGSCCSSCDFYKKKK